MSTNSLQQAVAGGGATQHQTHRPLTRAVRIVFAVLVIAASLTGLAGTPVLSAVLPETVQARQERAVVAFLLDKSSSMSSDERMKHLVEAARLGVFLLAGDFKVVAFSETAITNPTFHLKTQRKEAVRFIEDLVPSGGTSYLAAIEALDVQPLAVVFLSDGMPQDQEEAIFNHLRSEIRCPVHTIAMTTTPEAEQLLARMAAATGGGFYRVRQPAGVVEAFLRVLQTIRGFRRYDMNDRALKLGDVEGEVLLIGCNAEPRISSSEKLQRQTLPLAGSEVRLARAFLSRKRSVTVTRVPLSRGGPPGPVIVLRFDMIAARMELQRVGSSGSQTTLQASSVFFDARGRQIDPRGNAKLTARFELLDDQGNVVASVSGRPASDRPALEAVFSVPDAESGFYEVVCQTTDSSCGSPFSATEKRVVDVAAMPVVPKVRAATAVNASAGRPGEEIRLRIEVEAIGPLEAARRTFLEAVVKSPPAVVVHTPDGRAVDSRLRPEAFILRAATSDGTKATFELGFLAAEASGEYTVEVQEGSAGGVTYPAATATARCVDDDVLQLLVVETTTAGRRVLFDSLQSWCRPALAGNKISLELVRGVMDPHMFLGLEGGLVARLIGKDGAVRDVELTLQSDRYVTEAVVMTNPGILKVEVDIALEWLRLRYEGQIEIQQVVPQLSVVRQPVCAYLGELPCGAIVPLEVTIAGKTTNGQAATTEVLWDLIRRDRLGLRCVLRNAASKEIHAEEHTPSHNPWATTVCLRQLGQQVLTIELLDGKNRVLDKVPWPFRVVESPFKVSLMSRYGDRWQSADDSGSGWACLLPLWLVKSPDCRVIVQNRRSPFLTGYYLSGVVIDEQEVHFDAANAWYAHPISRSGPITCIGRFQPYRATSSGPEVQVMQQPHFALPFTVRWWLLLLTLVLLITAVGLAGWLGLWVVGFMYGVLLKRHGHQLSLLSGDRCDTQDIVGTGGWWPVRELLVCNGGATHRLARRSEIPNGSQIVARVRQRAGGWVVCTAVSDLPTLPRGQSQKLEPGNESVQLDARTTLALEHNGETWR